MAFAQASAGSLRGEVKDELGGVIVGATVTVVDAKGAQKSARTNEEGVFIFNDLPAGQYELRVVMKGFANYETAGVTITSGQRQSLEISMVAAIDEEKQTVTSEQPIGIDPDNNANAIILRGRDLDALPDDPDALAAALQALAGPSAGPNGGQIYIDGFTGGRLPPKQSIREIRINRNPFSAEYERLGFGRIEIFTRPGTEFYRGGLFMIFNDESLNSRNPLASTRAPFQQRLYNAYLGGPLKANRASFFASFNRIEIDDNAIVNAIILDPALNLLPFTDSILAPTRTMTIGPRFDFQVNKDNIVTAQYSYTRSNAENAGIGGFSLGSRSYDTSDAEHTLRLSEVSILSPRLLNEVRFQFIHNRRRLLGDNTTPALTVLEAFAGGGSQVGDSSSTEKRWEVHEAMSLVQGRHTIRFGGRLRGVHLSDISRFNFGGTYIFAGGPGPQLDANNQVVLDDEGNPVIATLTSLERYRRTLFFQQQGLSPAEIRALGGGATQFSISGGNPEAAIRQLDFSGYIQDDFRWRPNWLLSLGLRYETQTNISSNLNFGPRISFAWSPGATGAQPPRFVLRGGFGVFYERFSEGLSLQARRFDGINQQQFVVLDPQVLDLFPLVPSVGDLRDFQAPLSIRRVDDGLTAPYTLQYAFSVERMLPWRSTVSVTYINSRVLHVLRTRNINAPLPGSGERPFGEAAGNILQVESSGIFKQHQMIVSVNNRYNNNISLFATYALGKADSDSDGAQTFPSDPYDLTSEYGRASIDSRHRFNLGGVVGLPWGLHLFPLIVARSGAPFNIIIGRDLNGDTLITERPALATDLSRESVVTTRFGAFDLSPLPGQPLIPRNFGQGPGFFSFNLRLTKTFAFGKPRAGNAGPPAQGAAAQGARRPAPVAEKPYNVSFSIQALNLFNRTNLGTPIGNLSSPLFGQSNTAAAAGFTFGTPNPSTSNRRIEMRLGFNF